MKQDSNIKLIGICTIVVLFAVQALGLYLGVKRNASRPQCPPCTERSAVGITPAQWMVLRNAGAI